MFMQLWFLTIKTEILCLLIFKKILSIWIIFLKVCLTTRHHQMSWGVKGLCQVLSAGNM